MQRVWYRKSKNAWFAYISEGGTRKQLRLLQAPNDRHGKKLAEAQLLKELAARGYDPAAESEEPSLQSWLTVGHVLRGFLRHSKEEHAKETADWHGYLLNPFLTTWGRLRVSRLRKKHVKAWVKAKKYNPTSAAKAIGVLKRAFNWAVEEEHIPRNPIAHVRKPKPLTRDRTLTPEERKLILGSIKDRAFRKYVHALTLTGARPGEVARVCAAEVDLLQGLWIMTRHKTVKKTGKPRLIHLSPEALELTRELMERHPTGPLFLSALGKPWTRNAVRIRFRRLRKKHPELKGIVAYTYRGSFATDALEAGVPDASVAALLGHTGTATLHKFYNRLSSRTGHLKDAAEKATRTGAGDAPGGTPE
jgi:integrase